MIKYGKSYGKNLNFMIKFKLYDKTEKGLLVVIIIF